MILKIIINNKINRIIIKKNKIKVNNNIVNKDKFKVKMIIK